MLQYVTAFLLLLLTFVIFIAEKEIRQWHEKESDREICITCTRNVYNKKIIIFTTSFFFSEKYEKYLTFP